MIKSKSLKMLLCLAMCTLLSTAYLANAVNLRGVTAYGQGSAYSALDEEIKIYVSNNGLVKKTGGNTVDYTLPYVEGDVITVTAPEGVKYLEVKLDEYAESSIVYLLDGKVSFSVPTGKSALPYGSNAFKGSTHTITARVADVRGDEYRNVALNNADQFDDTNVYPHAIASTTNPNEAAYAPFNAIDGKDGTAWQGTAKSDAEFSVIFGRAVKIDKIEITLSDSFSRFTGAVLEFSDGSEMPVSLRDSGEAQTFSFNAKVTSWVRLKDLAATGKYVGISGFKAYGSDAAEGEQEMLTQEAILHLITKLNDKFINNNLTTIGADWATSTFSAGLIEAYYLTGDENYYDHLIRWANTFNWQMLNQNTNLSHNTNPDSYSCVATYIDLCNIDSAFDANFASAEALIEKIANNELGCDATGKPTQWWTWIDLFFMGMPVYTKMYLRTGDEKYLDKLWDFYNYEKNTLGLYAGDGMWYRDAITGDKNFSGAKYAASPNGKKIIWSRGNGWVFGGLAKILQDLPDDNPHREEFETMFKDMAAMLVQTQGDDGFWRQNLADPEHVTAPETSGTLFFLYGIAWGINNNLLDYDAYYPTLLKGFNGVNANAIHPDGFIGRIQDVAVGPDIKTYFGSNTTRSYSVGVMTLMLCELYKLEGGVQGDDLRPMLNKKMINAVAVKVGSPYAADGDKIVPLSLSDKSLTPVEYNGEVYVPVSFAKQKLGIGVAQNTVDINSASYMPLSDAASAAGKKLCVQGDVIVISHKENLFNADCEQKVINLLDTALTNGCYPARPERQQPRFDYGDNITAGVSGWPSADGYYYSSKDFRVIEFSSTPAGQREATVEFDVKLSKNGIINTMIGFGPGDALITRMGDCPVRLLLNPTGRVWEAYTSYRYPITNDLTYDFFGKNRADGSEYVKGETYRVKVVIDIIDRTYDAYVTDSYGETHRIALNYAFDTDSGADATKYPSNIGRIYIQDQSRSNADGSVAIGNVKAW